MTAKNIKVEDIHDHVLHNIFEALEKSAESELPEHYSEKAQRRYLRRNTLQAYWHRFLKVEKKRIHRNKITREYRIQSSPFCISINFQVI